MTPLADKSAAWAAEMRAAQEATLPTAVVDGDGTGVYLVAGGSDVDVIDADPAPGVTHRWAASPAKPSDMAKVADRQLGQPQVTVPLGDSLVRTQGNFAGPSGKPFSLCHLTGNKFWLEGGVFSYQRVTGYDDDQPITVTETVIVESRSIFAAQDRTTILGFDCKYRKASPTDWQINLAFAERTVLPGEMVMTGPVCGMAVSFSGDPVVANYTPIGDPFLPWIALHTQGGDAFWQQQVMLMPSAYISPSQGFLWWP